VPIDKLIWWVKIPLEQNGIPTAMLEMERSEEAPYRGLPTRKRGGALLK